MSLKLTTWPGRIWDSVRTKWRGVLWVVGGLVLLSLLWCAVIEMPRWQVNRLMFSTDEVTRFELENEARRTVWQFMLGFGGLFALFVAWRRVRAMDKTARAALDQVKLVERGQITERFTRAIDQLGAVDKDGNPALEIRLGGIYALEHIARDSVRDHWTVMEVLTAYVRKNSPWRKPEGGEARPGAEATSAALLSIRKPDIQAILTVLGRRERSGETDREGGRRLDLSITDLWEATMTQAHLERALFCGAHLEGAGFAFARLKRVDFSGAHLQEADFCRAHLGEADFCMSHLEEADFSYSNLQGAQFRDAHMKGANLRQADLRQVKGLTCVQLMSARHWQDAYRDAELACGADIPEPPREEGDKPQQNANEE